MNVLGHWTFLGVTALSGMTALFGVIEFFGVMDLCILIVMVATQLCHHSQKSTPKRRAFTVYKLHFNTHMHKTTGITALFSISGI